MDTKKMLIKEITGMLRESEDIELIRLVYIMLLKENGKTKSKNG